MLTTLTLFGIKKGNIRWGLAQMGTSPPLLKKVPGLKFFKLLGSGKGLGFSLQPDFRRYGLMAVWQSETAASEFLNNSALIQQYREHSDEIWTLKMQPVRSHGLWDGRNPFDYTKTELAEDKPIAVLTRASVRPGAVWNFAKFGLKTSRDLEHAPGLLASIGLGEIPLLKQATFSIWENLAAMQQYAYKSAHHIEVMKRTRAENWYTEELFARFGPVAASGTWNGHNPLSGNLPEI